MIVEAKKGFLLRSAHGSAMTFDSPMKSPSLTAILESLPMDAAVRIELVGGVPVFRAPPQVRAHIGDLLEQRELRTLDADELQQLMRYEELDDFLSLVNRLVRNEALGLGEDPTRVTAA